MCIRDSFQAALYLPLPQFQQNPEFQTEGQFDPQKYQRYLRSAGARQGGVLRGLEEIYRAELPRRKLMEQVLSTAYITDSQLWWLYQAQNDSARVTYVSFTPELIPDSTVRVSEEEIRARFQQRSRDAEEQPGQATVSLTMIPRLVTAADTAAVRARLLALRQEIVAGAKFEEVASRESADSASAAEGGSLGRVTRGRFVPGFDSVAFALPAGELSQPVTTPFGYHLIRVDERDGDTIAVRHILLRVQQSDSSASRTDRLADQLASIGAGSDRPAAFDSAVRKLGLMSRRVRVDEGEPLMVNGKYVPDVSSWAFSGAQTGQTSELIDAEDAYYLARLDSLVPGGKPTLESMRAELRAEIAREKKLELLMPRARRLASAVASGQSLEAFAAAQGLTVTQSPVFTRVTPVPGLGQLNEVIGAAFGLSVGAVSAPVKVRTGVFVFRVDRRVNADRAVWEKQKQMQRERIVEGLREQRWREFLAGLRERAKIEDNRKEIQRASRESGT